MGRWHYVYGIFGCNCGKSESSVTNINANSFFLGICCSPRVAPWLTTTLWFHCELIRTSMGDIWTCSDTFRRTEEAYHQIMENIYALARCVMHSMTQFSADQIPLAPLPRRPRPQASPISTLRDSNEFLCDRFQQLVNLFIACCNFSVSLHYFVTDVL